MLVYQTVADFCDSTGCKSEKALEIIQDSPKLGATNRFSSKYVNGEAYHEEVDNEVTLEKGGKTVKNGFHAKLMTNGVYEEMCYDEVSYFSTQEAKTPKKNDVLKVIATPINSSVFYRSPNIKVHQSIPPIVEVKDCHWCCG